MNVTNKYISFILTLIIFIAKFHIKFADIKS